MSNHRNTSEEVIAPSSDLNQIAIDYMQEFLQDGQATDLCEHIAFLKLGLGREEDLESEYQEIEDLSQNAQMQSAKQDLQKCQTRIFKSWISKRSNLQVRIKKHSQTFGALIEQKINEQIEVCKELY